VVPGHARKPAAGGPSPIAVHDDGDVLGDGLRANRVEQLGFAQNDRIS